MARFFVNERDVGDGVITIQGGDAFHIARSLRMAVGDSLTVCDGTGAEYLCSLVRIRDDECTLSVEEKRTATTESPVNISLYMAYPKGDKLEVVVQKAVELGASRIVPFESSRCIKRPSPDKTAKITERLNRIAEEAAKQCGRAILPVVEPAIKLKDVMVEIATHELCLFCYEGEGAESLRTVLEDSGKAAKSISVIVGSEGGFSPEEAEGLVACGAKCVNLGPRILRCETAPDYCLSAISYFFEL